MKILWKLITTNTGVGGVGEQGKLQGHMLMHPSVQEALHKSRCSTRARVAVGD